MTEIKIREARREDFEDILKLKIQLAEHQNMYNRPMLTVQELIRDGFDSDPPYFKCLVAESMEADDQSPEIVGYALWFYAYAAFLGKSMHLEDLIVSKKCRGKGVGSKFMKKLAQICLDENLARITLEVLYSNETGIKFYEKHHGYNSTKIDNWVVYYFEPLQLQLLSS